MAQVKAQGVGNTFKLCLVFRMLYHYLDHKRKESSAQLHATYLVSGKFVDNGQTVRPVVAFIFFFYMHKAAALMIFLHCVCFSESQGVCCERGPAGRCVNINSHDIIRLCCSVTARLARLILISKVISSVHNHHHH